MNLRNQYASYVFLLIIGFSIVPFLLDHTMARNYSGYNYFILESLMILLAFFQNKENRSKFLLSPSFIVVSYININFFIGSIVFNSGLVIDFVLIPYSQWKYQHMTMAYFNCANLFIIMSYLVAHKVKILSLTNFYDLKKVSNQSLIIISALLIFLFSFLKIDLSFLGADGSFHIIPKSLGAILIFVVCFRSFNLTYRILSYLLVIFLFAVAAFEDKRDAIFLLLPVFLLEFTRYAITINFKKIILGCFVIGFISYLIIVMSILRGYGGFEAKGFFDATKYVKQYIYSESFIPSFMNNIEVSYTYFHSNNAIEYVLEDPSLMTYGSTLIKPLFIMFPRYMFPWKPDSIIHLYTSTFSKEMRDRGVSWPVSIQSELFWNFHFAGIIIGAFLFFIFNSVYLKVVDLIVKDEIINSIHLLYIYQQSLVLFRGSGMDQFIIDIILSTLFVVILKLIIKSLTVASKHA